MGSGVCVISISVISIRDYSIIYKYALAFIHPKGESTFGRYIIGRKHEYYYSAVNLKILKILRMKILKFDIPRKIFIMLYREVYFCDGIPSILQIGEQYQ